MPNSSTLCSKPPDFFDFIVIDECHRGGAQDESNWRGILDYSGEMVYIYFLKEGINDSFLTRFKLKQFTADWVTNAGPVDNSRLKGS